MLRPPLAGIVERMLREVLACKFMGAYCRVPVHARQHKQQLTMKPTTMPEAWPTKEERGMMAEVRAREAKGVSHMGTSARPNRLNLATPVAASTVIHLRVVACCSS